MTRDEFEPILAVAADRLGEEVRANTKYHAPDVFQQRVFDVLVEVARARLREYAEHHMSCFSRGSKHCECTCGFDELLISIIPAPESPQVPADGPVIGSGEPLFYMQDARTMVGNCMLWWAKDGAGYVCDIRQAHVYTLDEVTKRTWRCTDIAWDKAYTDSRIKPVIDHQNIDKSKICSEQKREREPAQAAQEGLTLRERLQNAADVATSPVRSQGIGSIIKAAQEGRES